VRHWIRNKVLTVNFVMREREGRQVLTSEHRLFGVHVGRGTYNVVGRWLGRKENDWRDPDGDFGRV